MGNGAGKKVAPAEDISLLTRRRFSNELAMVDAVVVATRWKKAAVVGRSAHHNSDKPSRTLPPREDFSKRISEANKDNVDKLTRIGSYRILKTLGEGAFAKVKLAVHLITGEKVAMKIFDKTQERSEYEHEHFFREADIGHRLLNAHCCQLLEIVDTEHMYVLIFELIATDVLAMIEIAPGQRLDEDEARPMLRQLIAGVQGMHNAGVVHRDLKPENIGVDADNNIKILDFGLCGDIHADAAQDGMLATQCGTLSYSAPELLGGTPYGPSVDVWSIGVVLYSMLTGFLPYQGQTSLTTLHANMLDHQYDLPQSCSDDLSDLFKRVFEVKPKRRITLADLWDHPWIKAGGVPPISPDAVNTALAASQVDPEIIRVMEECNFRSEEIKKSVVANKCDPTSATYHILAKAKARTGAVPQISGKVQREKSLKLTPKQKRELAARRRANAADTPPHSAGPSSKTQSVVALRHRPNAGGAHIRKAQTVPPGKGRPKSFLRMKIRVQPTSSSGRGGGGAMIR